MGDKYFIVKKKNQHHCKSPACYVAIGKPIYSWANMKELIIGIIVFSSLVAGSVVADGRCATEQCEEAQKIPNLPTDVKSFVEQRDGCDHFRGEPWPEGNDPGDKERRDFISKNLNILCTGTDKSLKELRNKYRDNRAIAELLRKYEDRIERR